MPSYTQYLVRIHYDGILYLVLGMYYLVYDNLVYVLAAVNAVSVEALKPLLLDNGLQGRTGGSRLRRRRVHSKRPACCKYDA